MFIMPFCLVRGDKYKCFTFSNKVFIRVFDRFLLYSHGRPQTPRDPPISASRDYLISGICRNYHNKCKHIVGKDENSGSILILLLQKQLNKYLVTCMVASFCYEFSLIFLSDRDAL